MRSVAAGIITAEAGQVLKPRHEATVWRDILSFPAVSIQTNASLDTAIPQTYRMGASATTAVAMFRYTNGRAYAKAINPTTAADWALTTTGATEIDNAGSLRPVMRYGLGLIGSDPAYFAAVHDASGIQVKSVLLVSPFTEANYGPVFGPARVNTSSEVTRVEAICPTDNGVIVAVGTHLFDAATYPHKLSTVRFYWITNPAATVAWPLQTLIQADNTDSYTNWYSCAKWASFVSAIALGSGVGAGIAVFAYDGRHTVTWTIKAGIESEPRLVVPVDSDVEAVSFRASSVTVVNGIYYLAGRMTRKATKDGATVSGYDTAYDGYLMSADGVNWSLGERSHYLTASDCAGALLLASSPLKLYYGGNLRSTSATLGLTQNPSATITSTTGRVLPGWSLQQIANGADALSGVRLRNNDGAFDAHAVAREGSILKVRSGQGTTLSDLGIYGLDDATGGVTKAGRLALDMTARDLGGKILAAWKCPVDAALRGRQSFTSALENLDGWIRKSPERERNDKSAVQHLTTDATNGLVFAGLNDPTFLYLDSLQSLHGDGLTRLTARFDVADGPFLSAIGVLIGTGDDDTYGGAGTVVLIPRSHSWTGHQQNTCKVQRLNLAPLDPAEPDKEGSGFTFKRHVAGLWESVLSGTQGKRTLPVSGTYRTDVGPALAAGTWYDLVVRTAGARVQVFKKLHDYEPASCANNAGFTMVSEFLFDHQARKRLTSGRSYTGLALGTDVFMDASAFAHAVYDDVGVSLTAAGEADASYYATLMPENPDWSVGALSDWVVSNGALSAGDWAKFVVGQRIRIKEPVWEEYRTIIDVDPAFGTYGGINVSAGLPGTSFGHVYLASKEEYAFATSRAQNYTEFGGATRLNDPGAVKAALLLYGAGCIVSNDNTALSLRKLKSDGVTHWLMDAGWDSALASTWPGGAGTDESAWRIVFHHHRIMDGWVSEDFGLSTAGFMQCDDEVFRYVEQSFTRFDQNVGPGTITNTSKWTLIPTFYSVVQAQNAPSAVYNNYDAGAGYLGNDFDTIDDVTNPVGLLAQLEARVALEGFRLPVEEQPPQAYVLSQTGHSITIGQYDEAFGSIGSYTPEVQAELADLMVLSGRGQFGTERTGHSPRAPVIHYPCDTTGNPARISIKRFAHFSGCYQSAQDAIKRACALAGLRGATFRNGFTTPAAAITQAITTTPYTLPLNEQMSNFVLDLNAHIPANGTGTAFADRRLNITFRGYYRLTLQQYNTAAEVGAVQQGHVRVMLSTTSTDIDAPSTGDHRWLQWAIVPMGDYNPCGAYSGSTPNFTATDTATLNCAIRLSVKDNLIAVDINGQHVWTFDLDEMVAADGTSYRVDSSGDITIAYTATIAGNSATMIVEESGLGSEVPELLVREAESARSAIDRISGEMHVTDIPDQAGGRVFSQFWVRDAPNALQKNLLTHDWSVSDYSVTAHQRTVGKASGEAIDETEIRDRGYSYDSSQAQGEVIDTVPVARDEARLIIREQQEYAQTDQLTGYGRIELQPEDKVALVYDPDTGDVPAHASTDHVVTSVTLTANAEAMRATYQLRRFISA